MDSNTIIVENNNSWYFGAFLLFIIIMVIVVVIILLVVPRSTVALFGACTEQSECGNGLICSASRTTGSTGGICLGGLNYACNNNSDCAKNYFCLDNSFTNTKVCMLQPQITTTQNNPTFVTSTPVEIGNPVTVAPIINLSLPQNFTPTSFTNSFTTPSTSCNNVNTMTYNPQAIINSILPNNVNSGGIGGGFGRTREFRSFTPMGINTLKKKL